MDMTIKKNTGIYMLILSIFIYMYLRMISYFTPAGLNEVLLLIIRVFITSIALVKIITYKNIPYGGFVGSAILFWIISIMANVYNVMSVRNILYDALTQSWWLFVFMYFYLYLREVDDTCIHKIINICEVFYFCYLIRYSMWLMSGNRYWSSGGINAVYYSILLLPLMYYDKRRWLRILMCVLASIVVIISGKRTAFFILLAVAFIPNLIPLKNTTKGKKRGLTIWTLFISCIVIYFVIQRISEVMDITFFQRLSQISEDGGSGRFTTYGLVWNSYKTADPIRKLFGHGFNAVSLNQVSISSAHNDFLEILYDYGLIGLGVYVVFVIQLIMHGVRLYKMGSNHFPAYISALCIYFIMSMASHLIIYPTYIVYLMLVFALSSRPNLMEGKNAI